MCYAVRNQENEMRKKKKKIECCRGLHGQSISPVLTYTYINNIHVSKNARSHMMRDAL